MLMRKLYCPALNTSLEDTAFTVSSSTLRGSTEAALVDPWANMGNFAENDDVFPRCFENDVNTMKSWENTWNYPVCVQFFVWKMWGLHQIFRIWWDIVTDLEMTYGKKMTCNGIYHGRVHHDFLISTGIEPTALRNSWYISSTYLLPAKRLSIYLSDKT